MGLVLAASPSCGSAAVEPGRLRVSSGEVFTADVGIRIAYRSTSPRPIELALENRKFAASDVGELERRLASGTKVVHDEDLQVLLQALDEAGYFVEAVRIAGGGAEIPSGVAWRLEITADTCTIAADFRREGQGREAARARMEALVECKRVFQEHYGSIFALRAVVNPAGATIFEPYQKDGERMSPPRP